MLVAPTIAIVVFAGLLVYLGYIHGDKKDAESYNMAGRAAPPLMVAFGAFTVVGAGEFVGMTSFAYDIGIYVFVLTLGFALGAIILALFGRRAHENSRIHKFYSLPDSVAFNFGRFPALLVTLVSIAALGALLLIQISLGGYVLSVFLGIDILYTIAGITAVVILYVWLGGMRAILFTDVVQGLAMLLFLIAIAGAVLFGTGVSGDEFWSSTVVDLFSGGDASLCYFAVTTFFQWAPCNWLEALDVWQRLFVARDFSSARHGLLTTSVALHRLRLFSDGSISLNYCGRPGRPVSNSFSVILHGLY